MSDLPEMDFNSEEYLNQPLETLAKLASKINKNTKAVIYVTLNGRSGFIKQIQKICKKKKLHLIEDSAHSIGSYLNKKHLPNIPQYISKTHPEHLPKHIQNMPQTIPNTCPKHAQNMPNCSQMFSKVVGSC